MPINFNKNQKEEISSNEEFPFDISCNALNFVVPIKANRDSFDRFIIHAGRLKLERGIANQEELTDSHLQVDRVVKMWEKDGLLADKQSAKTKLYEYHQVELLRLLEDVSYLVVTEGFFKFNPITFDLDIVGGDINKIKVDKKYWETLKNPYFGKQDDFSPLYPTVGEAINFPSYRKNIERKPLEIMIAIIKTLREKELENLSLTKEHLKNSLSNSEISESEYTDIIKATENTNFAMLVDKYAGIFGQEYLKWRNNLSGNSFRTK